MQFNLELKIFPTSRAIREFLKSEDSNRLLPTFLTIDDFFKKSLEIKNRKYIDEEQRLLYLKEAINVDNFEDLGMSKDFSSFINQSDYIFRFFQEISSEKLTIDQISSVDTYEYYDAHLKILKRIYNNYLKILD
ncbi:MAG: PD-(D/E)XK nuclease family protein, partial [Campylobacteraceae bacterium]|nr:PD-(D/E)XK nuclease family protein [Campylobacteraceae bacterium]